MTVPMKHVAMVFLAMLGLTVQTGHAIISISVTGSWVNTIDQSDLVSGAGSDLQDTYTGVSGQVTIDISGTIDADDAWRVDVRKVDSTWDSDLHPSVKRTSNGTGGSVSGGTAFQEITNLDATFFSGSGDVWGRTIQLRLAGASLQIDPASNSTVIYYTVVDI